jgi:hypothetical protein
MYGFFPPKLENYNAAYQMLWWIFDAIFHHFYPRATCMFWFLHIAEDNIVSFLWSLCFVKDIKWLDNEWWKIKFPKLGKKTIFSPPNDNFSLSLPLCVAPMAN